jgi:hypothetical protein
MLRIPSHKTSIGNISGLSEFAKVLESQEYAKHDFHVYTGMMEYGIIN